MSRIDWSKARPARPTQSIADDARKADMSRHLGLSGRPRRPPPSKASLRALTDAATKEFAARKAVEPKPDHDEERPPWK